MQVIFPLSDLAHTPLRELSPVPLVPYGNGRLGEWSLGVLVSCVNRRLFTCGISGTGNHAHRQPSNHSPWGMWDRFHRYKVALGNSRLWAQDHMTLVWGENCGNELADGCQLSLKIRVKAHSMGWRSGGERPAPQASHTQTGGRD